MLLLSVMIFIFILAMKLYLSPTTCVKAQNRREKHCFPAQLWDDFEPMFLYAKIGLESSHRFTK
ncbi:hypothetical protein CQ11_04240 [Trueperella pyogenes]|nr:hypothetical protein CQ11_04240 [Trueperella pyogenes]